MKPILCLTIATLLAGCHKTPAPIDYTPPIEAIAEVPTPAPKPPPATATPTPAKAAPNGVFFLLTPISVETDSGITVLRPGTRVERTPGLATYKTPLGEMSIASTALTNDPDLARRSLAGYHATTVRPVEPPPTLAVTATPTPAKAAPMPTPAPPSTTTLGASHTRTKDGWLWQRKADGDWKRVRPLK